MHSKSNLFRQLLSASDEFIGLSKKADDNLSLEEKKALVELAKDKSIVISKADKGNAVMVRRLQAKGHCNSHCSGGRGSTFLTSPTAWVWVL